MTHQPRIGLDIGGTKIEGIALDAADKVVARRVVSTVHGPAGVLEASAELASALASDAGHPLGSFAGIGIGIPGQVDRISGSVRNAYNMGIAELALAPELSTRTGLEVFVDNDVTAAAIGAVHVLGIEGTVAYVNLGTGLAAGVTIDGQALRGADGYAGEIGHLPIDPRGRACLCGQSGCLETVASGSALQTHWPAGGAHPGRNLATAAATGDDDAVHALEYLIDGAANAVRVIGLTHNPHAVVIGGGLRLVGAPLLDGIRQRLSAWADASEFLAELELHERLVVLPTDSPAAAIGAAIAVNDSERLRS